MENHLTAKSSMLPGSVPTAARWMQSRLHELEFSGAIGRLRQFLRHPLDILPGHPIGKTFQDAARWTSPLPVVHQELQGYRDGALDILRKQSLRLLAALENQPSGAAWVPYNLGRQYESILRYDFHRAREQWDRFLEQKMGGSGIPCPPSSSLPDRLPLPVSRLEQSIDALGWAVHTTAARHSMRVVVDGILEVMRNGPPDSATQMEVVRLIDGLEIASERQLLISQQLRIDMQLLQPDGLPLPEGSIPSSDTAERIRNLSPYLQKLAPRLRFSAGDLMAISGHPLHDVLQKHLLLIHHPPVLLEESQARLEMYQMTREAHRQLRPLRQMLSGDARTGFDQTPPSVMLEVMQLSALQQYIHQARDLAPELNSCPPPIRSLVVSGFTHASVLEQFGGRKLYRGYEQDAVGVENQELSALKFSILKAPEAPSSPRTTPDPSSGFPPFGFRPGTLSR